MHLINIKTLAISLLLIFIVASTKAQNFEKKETNVRFCLYCPLQVVPEDFDVYGVRFTVPYGVNKKVYGLDCGVWSVTTGYQYGIQTNGMVAYHEHDADGFVFAGIFNYTEKNSTGCIIGGFYNEVREKMTGFQTASITATICSRCHLA